MNRWVQIYRTSVKPFARGAAAIVLLLPLLLGHSSYGEMTHFWFLWWVATHKFGKHCARCLGPAREVYTTLCISIQKQAPLSSV